MSECPLALLARFRALPWGCGCAGGPVVRPSFRFPFVSEGHVFALRRSCSSEACVCSHQYSYYTCTSFFCGFCVHRVCAGRFQLLLFRSRCCPRPRYVGPRAGTEYVRAVPCLSVSVSVSVSPPPSLSGGGLLLSLSFSLLSGTIERPAAVGCFLCRVCFFFSSARPPAATARVLGLGQDVFSQAGRSIKR